MKRLILFLAPCLILAACQHRPLQVTQASEELISIDTSLDAIADSAYLTLLEPVRLSLEEQLSKPLGTAPEHMQALKPESNLLNWSADALLHMAQQVSGQDVDMSVVNIGGLRCEWPAGDITFRNVFELMPFDNELVILTLTGQDLLDLAQCFAEQGGQGMSGMRLVIHNNKAERVTLNSHPIVPQMLYRVATSDYLSEGNDRLTPLNRYSARWNSGMKIRDLYIDYIRQHPIVSAPTDGRTTIR